MGKPLIVVGSITYAMKSRDLLQKNGFQAFIERVPHTGTKEGCGYGIYVPQKAEEAEQLLKKRGIQIKGRVYRDDGD